MKKIAWALALAAPMILASCGTESDVTLNETNVTIDYKGTTTLTASEKNGTWSSSDNFVASVDNSGKISALHVGEAVITYSTENGSASCKVNVIPTDNSFVFPYLNWGSSYNNIQSMISTEYLTLDEESSSESDGELWYDTKTGKGFQTYGNGMPWFSYLFTNNALTSVGMAVPFDEAPFNAVCDWLEQYYQDLSNDNDAYPVYGNAFTAGGSNVRVTLNAVGSDYDVLSAVWTPLNSRSDMATEIERQKAVLVKKLAK
ncbi:MAG: Ig domain-containing protein [Bacteroides sp.]|nr:Ig domain-containing protein [Bacteroides sp.]